ncbi:hypothetical protein [Streptomyces sp. NPDC049949]|uniref:hypothetical protein n=1 Tax=unclassified Streptomyces TaxID=2593676 RepID=UPI003245F3EE
MAQQSLSDRLTDALALLAGKHTVRCPHAGCTVRIRYRNVTPEEVKRLAAVAVDHDRHGNNR